MDNIKIFDVVKWTNPIGTFEQEDVMVVENVDNDFIQVRHLTAYNKSKNTSTTMAKNVRVVGHCTPSEPIFEIVSRYLHK